jgi:pantothenate kinase-related protein Tda10
MKGDIIILEEHHIHAARKIVPELIDKIKRKTTRYAITVGGESGSGKSETGQAIANELEKQGIKSVLLAQDDYFFLPVRPLQMNWKNRASNPFYWLKMIIFFYRHSQTMPKDEQTRNGLGLM